MHVPRYWLAARGCLAAGKEATEMSRPASSIPPNRNRLLALGLAAGVVLAVPGTASAATELLGKYDAWAAFLTKEKGRQVCYIESEPRRKKGNYTKRGDVFVQVIHRPWKKGPPEVGFNAGYRLAKQQNVKVGIGQRNFILLPEEGVAWPQSVQAEARLVTAMKKGAVMVVQGKSWRGTLTTDTYSLDGFTAALKAAYRACK